MKSRPLKIRFGLRVILFIIGSACGLLPVNAIRYGKFHMGDHGSPFEITQLQDPIMFWALAFVFSLLSAGILYVAFAKRLPDG
jgi:hypothetical protein